MPTAWGKNPKVIELISRDFQPYYSSCDPLGEDTGITEDAGEFQFSTTNKAVDEDAGSITIFVNRVNGSEGEVTVDYATANGTAVAGVDYTATNGTFTFAAGETQKSINVPIIDNSTADGDLNFEVGLSNPSGDATLGSPSTIVITIRDDESELASGEHLLTRIKVENNSGSSSPQDQVYTFGSPIEPGQVHGTRTVELRHNGVAIPYQMDGECHQHPDGTLNFATFTCRLPAIADGASEFIELIALDGSKPTGSVDETPLTNADYNLQLVVGGTTYTASLNDALSANQYDVERDGPVAKRYRAHIAFNDGSSDHAHLWARFYATAFADGSTQVMAQVVNGHMDTASNVEYTDLVLRSGTTTVRSMTYTWEADVYVYEGSHVVPTTPNGFVYEAQEVGGFSGTTNGSTEPTWPTTIGETVTDGGITWQCRAGVMIYTHSVHSVADEQGFAYWDSNAPLVHHKLDRGYLPKARAWWAYHDLSIGEYSGNLIYRPGAHGQIKYAINSGGDAEHLGFITNWSTKALINQTAGNDKQDRVNALYWLDAPFSVYESDGRLPVLVGQDFTADGLNASRPNDGWFAEVTIPRGSTPWNTVDGTHNPQIGYYQTLKMGDEWFRDIVVAQANNAVGVGKQGSGSTYPGWQRRIEKMDGSGDYWDGLMYRSEMRAWGWNMRDLECAHWILPDGVSERNYLTYLRSQNLGYTDDLVDYYETVETEYAALGVIKNTNERNTVWQSSFQACGLLFMHWHGASEARKYSDYHFVRNLFGQAKDGHPYYYGEYYLFFNPEGTGVVQTWDGVDRDGDGNPFLPQGEEVPYSTNRANQNGAVGYAIIGLGAARFAQIVARDRQDELLLEYASYVATYIEQTVKYNHPVSDSEFAGKPKYRTIDYAPLDFEDDALADALALLSVGEWSANLANNAVEDVSVQKADNYGEYYGVEGHPNPSAGSQNHWAYSSGDLNRRTMEYGFTGGGHSDHLDSSFYKFDFKTLTWRKTDHSAKYVEGVQDDTQPFQTTDNHNFYAWRSADGSFAPASTHTYGGVVYVDWIRGWYVLGTAVFKSGQGYPGGSVIADSAGFYREDTAWPGGVTVPGVNHSHHVIEDAQDVDNGVTVPLVMTVTDRNVYSGDPLDKVRHGRVAYYWDVRPEPGSLGCIIPDPDNPGFRGYVANDTESQANIVRKADRIPVNNARWEAIPYANSRPADVNRRARWIYLGDHIEGSTKIMVVQPLDVSPGVVLYALDAVTFEWSGPYSFTGSVPGWTSQDEIYWRRCVYIPEYDCIVLFYRPDDNGVYAMKRPSALA